MNKRAGVRMNSMIRVRAPQKEAQAIEFCDQPEPQLIITDDDTFARSELREFFSSSGIVLAEACNGNALIKHLNLSPGHSIVLLDLYIPGDDVCETIARLAALPTPVVLILFSGYASAILENVAHLAESYGVKVAGVINKPFSLQSLNQLIRRAHDMFDDIRLPAKPVWSPSELKFSRQDITDAMTNGQITAFYQPQISVRDEKCRTLEALVRWIHPTRGLLEPKQFLDDVRTHRLFKELTYHILEEMCADMARWSGTGFKPDVAVNVYPDLLTDTDFSQEFLRLIELRKIDPRRIIVELTEDAFLLDHDRALEALIRLHMAGVRISIDDFGTEHSSLSRLLWLPISEIKIDKSFVDAFCNRKNAIIIVKEVIDLAHKLGLVVVAEGVETNEVLNLLKKLNCDSVQGYLFSAAVPAAKIVSWVRNREMEVRGQAS